MKTVNMSAETKKGGVVDFGTRTVLEQKKTKESDTAEQCNGESRLKGGGATVEISEEAKQKYAELLSFKQSMEAMRQQDDVMKENTRDIGKIMTIFRRICNGDYVPARDEKKLMEYSSDMYQAAKNIGALAKNEKPKKYKSVDEEEEQENVKRSQSSSIGISDMDEFAENSVEIPADLENEN